MLRSSMRARRLPSFGYVRGARRARRTSASLSASGPPQQNWSLGFWCPREGFIGASPRLVSACRCARWTRGRVRDAPPRDAGPASPARSSTVEPARAVACHVHGWSSAGGGGDSAGGLGVSTGEFCHFPLDLLVAHNCPGLES
mmetsp:Transcript_26042/g.78471  ORF Transcript_26042/g.78471 Transcript_26042/m.78471 type:complete len:143 (+) Transcript_26042:4030-4458(+)